MTLTATGTDPVHFAYALDQYQSWRLHESGSSPRTWAGEKSTILGFVDFMHQRGVHTPGAVADTDVSAWWQTQAVHARSTKATRLSQLRTFLTHCQRRGWMPEGDPTWRIGATRPRPGLRNRLTALELVQLLDVAGEPRDRVLMALLENLALRNSDLSNLRIRHLHFEDEVIDVFVEKPDTWVQMPMSLDLMNELHRWLDVYRSRCPEVNRESFVVPSRWTSTVSDRVMYYHFKPQGQLYRSVQRVLLAGVSQGVVDPGTWTLRDPTSGLPVLDVLGRPKLAPGEGGHTVRRSVARIMFDAAQAEGQGFDEALVATMALLHHSNPQRTLDYIGVDRRQQALDRILRGRPFLSRLAGNPRDTSRDARGIHVSV
jgi:site-specific recombinase XerC